MARLSGLNILVTGGSGFIGGHLVGELLRLGANVIAIDRDVKKNSLFERDGLRKEVRLEFIDVADKEKIFRFIKLSKPDYIFHLAAQTLVTESYTNPYDALNTNIMGTVNILEAARIFNNTRGIIVASSDKAYGKTKKTYTENSPLKGDHPYDVSKSSADLICQAYHKTYDIPVVITRFGNVYGEGDLHFERIVPGICRAIIKNEVLEIRSNGKYVRDYIYVKDVVNGYIVLQEHIDVAKGQAYNFSSRDTISVLELVRKVQHILNVDIPYVVLNSAKNEIPYQHLDDTKVRSLGWIPYHSFDSVFPATVDWYRKVL